MRFAIGTKGCMTMMFVTKVVAKNDLRVDYTWRRSPLVTGKLFNHMTTKRMRLRVCGPLPRRCPAAADDDNDNNDKMVLSTTMALSSQ